MSQGDVAYTTCPISNNLCTALSFCLSQILNNNSLLVHHVVQENFHALISPALCRVYLGDGEGRSRAVIDDLNLEIATLKVRVVTLKHEKQSSSKGLLSRNAVSRHTLTKSAACLAPGKANRETRRVLWEC